MTRALETAALNYIQTPSSDLGAAILSATVKVLVESLRSPCAFAVRAVNRHGAYGRGWYSESATRRCQSVAHSEKTPVLRSSEVIVLLLYSVLQ